MSPQRVALTVMAVLGLASKSPEGDRTMRAIITAIRVDRNQRTKEKQ